jgi:hypothetical protein
MRFVGGDRDAVLPENLERIPRDLGAEVVVARQSPREIDGVLRAQADVDRDVGQSSSLSRGSWFE